MKKFFHILILLLFLPGSPFAQNTTQRTDEYGALPQNYGIVEKPYKQSYLNIPPKELFRGVTGSTVPINKYQEKLYKKLIKLRLTKKEAGAILKHELSNQPLTPTEQLYYIRAKNKINKRQLLLQQYVQDTSKVSASKTAKLTPEEQQLLEKSQDSTAQLTPFEKRLVKQIKKKQKRYEKQQKKYTLTEEDKKLLNAANSDSAKLSLGDKIKLIQVKQKKERIDNYQLQQELSKGNIIPVKVKTIDQIKMAFKYGDFYKKSHYVKRTEYLKKKYGLTPKEKDALNKAKGQYEFMTRAEKARARRAQIKQYKYNEKIRKLNEKYFLSLQDEDTRKRFKTRKHKQDTDRVASSFQRSWTNLKNYINKLF